MATAIKNKSVASKKAAPKKPSAKKSTVLPGTKVAKAFLAAKAETKKLINVEAKKLSAAKQAVLTSTKKLKLMQDSLKKLEAKHQVKANKTVAKQISSTKSKIKQAEVLATKAHGNCNQVTERASCYQNHLKKLDHQHKLVTASNQEWKQ